MKFVVENACDLTLVVDDFDDLSLTGENIDSAGNVFTIDALDEGATWDSPQPVDTAVARWKTDGAIAQTQNYDNRTISFQVVVSGDDSQALAAGEVALALRAGQSCRLRWLPPQGDPDAAPTDFEVWTWHLAHSFAGLDERYLRRVYLVTMTAKPWATSSSTTTAPAIPTPGSPLGSTTVDACGSTTNWTGSPNAPTTSGGAVKETRTVPTTGKPGQHVGAFLTRTAAVTGLDVQPYLALTMSVTGGTTTWYVFADGVELVKVGQVGQTSYWQMPTGVSSLTVLKVSADIAVTKTATSVTLSIADVSKTDTVGGVGSRKQLTRSLAVGGSVKTSGSIKVASPSGTGLGTVLVYTQPDNGLGFNPGLRQYRTSGGTQTSHADAVSGFREPLASAVTFTIPANVVPEASYAVMGRLYASASGTATVGASVGTGALMAGTSTGGKVTWTGAGYQWFIFGIVAFPLLSLPPESQVSSFLAVSSVGGTGVAYDEMYLLDITHGAYSLVNCGSYTRLWLDAPDASPKNRPQVFLGTLDDRSDAVGANGTDEVLVLGDHDFDPQGTTLASVTDGVDNALVSASFYQRWHTHAAA